jgi:hypothetical protein
MTPYQGAGAGQAIEVSPQLPPHFELINLI